MRIPGQGHPGAEPAAHPLRNRRNTAQVTDSQATWLVHHLQSLIEIDPLTWATSDLTLHQFMALHFICARSPISLSGLCDQLGTRPPATSALVDRLTRAGLVDRHTDPADHRRIRITTTDRAARALGHIDLDTAQRAHSILSTMSTTARRRLGDALTRTARHLTQ